MNKEQQTEIQKHIALAIVEERLSPSLLMQKLPKGKSHNISYQMDGGLHSVDMVYYRNIHRLSGMESDSTGTYSVYPSGNGKAMVVLTGSWSDSIMVLPECSIDAFDTSRQFNEYITLASLPFKPKYRRDLSDNLCFVNEPEAVITQPKEEKRLEGLVWPVGANIFTFAE